MGKLRNRILALLAFGAASLLSGCKQLVLLNPKGFVARDEKDLLIITLILMLIIVVPVLICTLLITYRYRASNKKAKYDPNFTHSTKLELLWWGLPIIIIAILATITWKTTHDLDPYKPIKPIIATDQPITIEAVSLNWRWLFIYPEQHIATINFVEFPVNTPIQFYVSSDAPMNSFVIQQLAGQIYAMSGMRTQLHLLASQTGDYTGRSISFSGDGFSNMSFIARVVNNVDFAHWIATSQKSKNLLTWNSYQALVPDSSDTDVYYFKLSDQNLFDEIIEKYTGPDMKMPATMTQIQKTKMAEIASMPASCPPKTLSSGK